MYPETGKSTGELHIALEKIKLGVSMICRTRLVLLGKQKHVEGRRRLFLLFLTMTPFG